MGWHKSPEGHRGYFSDDQGVPQDWTPTDAPDVAPEPEEAPEPPAKKPVKKAKRK